MSQADGRYMLKSIAGWLAINAFFVAFLLVFAGLVFVLMGLSKWITSGMAFEAQYFAGLLFGIAALGLTLWLMFSAIKRIGRRRR